jgi:uracil-DNA glycosylase
MEVNIAESWKYILQTEFEKPYFKDLMRFVNSEYDSYACFPDKKDIFAAFDACSFNDLKVVIIGQDPYHGIGQANGLCFSVQEGVKHPPSLVNIFKELETDLAILTPISGDLSRWATQGVLLLNATLTVKANEAGSHQKQGWEQFTDAVIEQISKQKKEIIFLLWGGFAQKKGSKIDANKHVILTSGHPSPLSANRRYWFGSKHFSKANSVLKNLNTSEIKW